MREAFRLRYRLAPYIYNAARRNYDTGVGMCRPMYYEWAECDEAYEVPEQFMFGDDILATVIAAPADSVTGLAPRRIWFPEGEWFDCATGEMISGGGYRTGEYTIAENPHYARAGAILPMNPASVKNLRQPCDTLVLTFIPGDDGRLDYYEDDGLSQRYAADYAVTTVTKKQEGNTLRVLIAPREGTYDGAPATRSYCLRFPAAFPPRSVKINGHEIPYARFPKAGEWTYDGYTLAPVIHTETTACDRPLEIELSFGDHDAAHQADLYGKQKWFLRCTALTEEFKFACGRFDTWMMLPVEYLRISQTPNRITEFPARIADYLAEFEAGIQPMHRSVDALERLDASFKKRLHAQLR